MGEVQNAGSAPPTANKCRRGKPCRPTSTRRRNIPAAPTARAARRACVEVLELPLELPADGRLGYVVVAPNRRGLPSFGQEWLDQISGDYSGQNIRDYLAAIDDVAREPWADETEWAVWAPPTAAIRSTTWRVPRKDGSKAFIAHCGIYDFDSMYGETRTVVREQRLRRPLLGQTETPWRNVLCQLAPQIRNEVGHADTYRHGRKRLPHPLHAIAGRSRHGQPGYEGYRRGWWNSEDEAQ